MKKVIMLAAVVAALASCQSKANKAAEAEADSLSIEMAPITEVTEVYEGTLPAADGPGIDYVLTLNAATDGVDTTYTLDMTYLDAEGQGKNKTFSSNDLKSSMEIEKSTVSSSASSKVEIASSKSEIIGLKSLGSI